MVQPQSFRRHPLVWGIGVIGVIAVVAVLAAVLVFTAGGGGGRAEATSGADRVEAVERALTEPVPGIPDGMPTERPNQLGRTSDQASPEEIGYARYLAYKAQGTTATRVDGTPGYEFIAADVKTQGVPAGERHIEVLSYDYSTDTSILQVVDLVDGTVTETRGGAATAPPSARESLFAMDLLIRSDEATDIRAAFAERTGEELTSPSQVSYVSSAQLPAGTRYLAPQCEGHRCVVFQPHFGADVALYYGDVVVDLSASQVYRVS